MKTIMNKKGNGIVILTTDEYREIIDAVFKVHNKIEYAISYKETFDSERIHEERANDPEVKAGYKMAQYTSINILESYLKQANEELSKLNEKF